MKTFTNNNLDKLRTSIETAMKKVEDNFDITIDLGNIRYTSDRLSFSSKLSVNIGSKADKEQNEWNKNCRMYSFSSDDFGKTFVNGGRSFKITGIAPRSRKYPIIGIECGTNEEFKFPSEAVRNGLNNS